MAYLPLGVGVLIGNIEDVQGKAGKECIATPLEGYLWHLQGSTCLVCLTKGAQQLLGTTMY